MDVAVMKCVDVEAASLALLERKIAAHQARLGVIGLGYVGLPLALAMARAGFPVTGFDAAAGKIDALRSRRSYITDVSDSEVAEFVESRLLVPTTEWDAAAEMDALILCVPTPLRKTKDPDLSCVIAAVDSIAGRLRRGQLIVLESTTYPGTTEEIVLPALERTGLKVGEDFCLAFSPERVDPGNLRYKTPNIPKVVGGVTARCAQLASLLYRQFVERAIVVSSTRVAEMVKLLENTFRSVNIALVNEIAMMCHHMKIDVWEVIQAAASKPFGYMPFYPGPGLGGHCIPVDPLYLLWKAKLDGFEPRFIGLADRINSDMPHVVVGRVMELLNDRGKALHGARVHVLGVAYKPDVGDTRESPALEILKLLLARGACVSYSDPFVPALLVEGRRFESLAPDSGVLANCDIVMIATHHSAFDYPSIVKHASLVFDTRNATGGLEAVNVVKL